MKQINSEAQLKLPKFKITVLPSEITFIAQPNETIVEAAIRNGFIFPHRCLMGVCSTCKGKLLEGQINYENPQQQSDEILFCCAKPKTDLLIHVQSVEKIIMPIQNRVLYQVTHQELLSKDISLIKLKTSDPPIPYQAGQYVKVRHNNGIYSPMSVACAPQDASVIEFHLHHPRENFQAIDLLRMVHKEKKLFIRGPYGSCTATALRLDSPIIFLANGTGLAPIKAIMQEFLCMQKTLPPIHLYQYAEDQSELYLQNQVTEWLEKLTDFRYTPLLSLTIVQAVNRDYEDLSQYQIYMVDTKETTLSALTEFMKHGLDKKNFFSDVLDYIS